MAEPRLVAERKSVNLSEKFGVSGSTKKPSQRAVAQFNTKSLLINNKTANKARNTVANKLSKAGSLCSFGSSPNFEGVCIPDNYQSGPHSASMAAGLSYNQHIDARTQAQLDTDAERLATVASFVTGGLSGLGIKAVLDISKTAVRSAIGISNKGLKHLKKHTNDFKQFDPNFSVGDQVDLGKTIARDRRNLIDNRYGGKGYEKTLRINKHEVTVRTSVNSSNNLRNVFPVIK